MISGRTGIVTFSAHLRASDSRHRPSARSLHHDMIYSCAIVLTIAARAAALSIAGVGSATASKNLPFENKDAFFTSPPRYYGVFDGVSQCDDSRAYAQTLAKTSMNELASIDQSIAKITFEEAAQGALTKAAKEAFKYSGCSTACLLKLDLESASPTASIM